MRQQRAMTAGRPGDNGQGFADYALVLGLIAIVSFVALLFLSGTIHGILSEIGAKLETPAPSIAPIHLVCTETSSSPLTIDCVESAPSPSPATTSAQPETSVAVASPAVMSCAETGSDPIMIECQPGREGTGTSPAVALSPGDSVTLGDSTAHMDCVMTSKSPLSMECHAAPSGR